MAIKKKPITLSKFICFLKYNVDKGNIKMKDKLFMASDEEGNSYSPIVSEGIFIDNGKIIIYPLFPQLKI